MRWAPGTHRWESSQSALRASLGLSQRWGLSMVPARVGSRWWVRAVSRCLSKGVGNRSEGAARTFSGRRRRLPLQWRWRLEIDSSHHRATLPAESVGQKHSERAQRRVERARAAHSQSIAEVGLSHCSGGSTDISEKRSKSGWRGRSSVSSSASPESLLMVSSSMNDALEYIGRAATANTQVKVARAQVNQQELKSSVALTCCPPLGLMRPNLREP